MQDVPLCQEVELAQVHHSVMPRGTTYLDFERWEQIDHRRTARGELNSVGRWRWNKGE